ncbi:alcohol dehydrogenase catalytic domain-containing protein [Jiella sonneratiae]|uniref:Alcohol dehydrogenase catalytic domain-containing protein n=1 Tax=Jiella sonneratiae TaxID=2816856 RepID=A0ABS3IYS8_9HYPH|nr:alcohol dehydrogenase catalytic domain-containing protein [Jiella sonneratiae]MBO0902559.1 alcohol dehydrogenase catalytic domain-containing protein [Jiella sonneratiae]
MKALVYTGPHTLDYRDEPQPGPTDGEAIVKVEAVGICGSDMHAYHGHDARRPAPLILGHEAAGTIAHGPRAGMRVTINPLVVDPLCPFAVEGRAHLSPTRQILSMPPRQGAFAGYVRVPERNLHVIGDDLPIEEAALAEPIAVSWHAVRIGAERLARPIATARVAVLGGGAIGLAAALVARLFAAAEISVGETNALRRRTLEDVGGLKVYDPGGGDGPEPDSVDLVVDAVGAGATRAAASRMVRPGGVIVHIGLLPGSDGLDIRKLTLQEVTLTGSYCYTPQDFADTVAALERRRFGAIGWTERRSLSEGARAFADIDAGTVPAAKIVLLP